MSMSKKKKRMALSPFSGITLPKGPAHQHSRGPSGPGMMLWSDRIQLPPQANLDAMTVAALRGLAGMMEVETKAKDRKADIIAKLKAARP